MVSTLFLPGPSVIQEVPSSSIFLGVAALNLPLCFSPYPLSGYALCALDSKALGSKTCSMQWKAAQSSWSTNDRARMNRGHNVGTTLGTPQTFVFPPICVLNEGLRQCIWERPRLGSWDSVSGIWSGLKVEQGGYAYSVYLSLCPGARYTVFNP